VYIWSIEQPNKAFISVDLKPENLEELSEVITSSKFHPTLDNIFLYTTSKGIIKFCDMRKVRSNTFLLIKSLAFAITPLSPWLNQKIPQRKTSSPKSSLPFPTHASVVMENTFSPEIFSLLR
jgi:hypothetical protein